ncbi:hypothetical protein [Blastopirellula marina]|uniref:Tetratricopeptide repeat protein n=1 Tax=Blastopirellula marina DSM 3645 TaxID=314230 RepID=A3ZU59_9BACT|nr:hypothetical protein [Blastopirellula marina]EAQ79842.1 hypothetical protein DSM3645_21919 [Blastopirellula marina DSM 3645]
MRITRRFLSLTLIAALTSVVAADQIRTESGGQSGSIVNSTKDALILNKSGSPVEIPVEDIVTVSFDDESFPLKQARQEAANGQLQDALDRLAKLEPSGPDLVKQESEYLKAYCTARLALAGSADQKVATELLFKFAQSAPNSWHFYEAAELLGDLAVAQQQYDRATLYYSSIANAKSADYRARARVLAARALIAQDKFAEASKMYDEVLALKAPSSGVARQKDFATVGKAICLAELGKPADGVKMIEPVLERANPKDIDLFSAAYNALGRCHQKAGQPKDALLAYLHTDILFYGNPEMHAEALYYLSKLWKEVNDPDKGVAAYDLLRSRYAGSRWANMN